MSPGSSPSTSQAATTAKTTSVSATKDATLEPSFWAARIPVTYAATVEISTSTATGTSQLNCDPAMVTSVNANSKGMTFVSPSRRMVRAPITIPPPAITSGGSESSIFADIRKKTMRHTAAASPYSTPMGSSRTSPAGSSTSSSPRIATTDPAAVSRWGALRDRIHSQPTISTGARYSRSSATPTESRSTALK